MANQTYTPKRVMVIVAHPDDIEFSCAGTIARWVKEGAEVCYVLCTSGDHVEPMFVLATQVCPECAAAACSEHELQHDETCERGARLARLRTQTPLDEDDIFSGGGR